MRYLVRRAGFYVLAIFVAVTFNFFIPRMMTGDPASILYARFQGRIDPRAFDSIKASFGFVEGPILEQYATYLQNLLQGNFGISIVAFPQPVVNVIGTGISWTLRLLGIATLLSFGFGILLGIFASWRRGKFIDGTVLPVFSMLGAFPYFWIALVFLYFFGMNLRWFPTAHAYSISAFPMPDWSSPQFYGSMLVHGFLPALTIVLTSIGGWMLGMRNNMIGVLAQDYIVMAQAKGLAERRIIFTYAARNAILPSLTGFAMSLGFILAGSLLVEVVFSYPGMGFLLLAAVNNRDYPLMQAIFLMITLAVLLANFIVDIAYVLLDPRAR
ncbi:MAG: ABC transporter permease [Anaerolineae bacterium]|nr:ABC transporter permease [Anaerolineae bacterium]